MTQEKRKEILKACYYGFTHDEIAASCGVSEDIVREVIENGLDYIEELKVRKYD